MVKYNMSHGDQHVYDSTVYYKASAHTDTQIMSYLTRWQDWDIRKFELVWRGQKRTYKILLVRYTAQRSCLVPTILLKNLSTISHHAELLPAPLKSNTLWKSPCGSVFCTPFASGPWQIICHPARTGFATSNLSCEHEESFVQVLTIDRPHQHYCI